MPPTSGTPTPPQTNPSPLNTPLIPHSPQRHILVGTASFVVLLLALVVGMQLAASDANVVCTRTVTSQGQCRNGEWTAWTSDTNTDAACLLTENRSRSYAGTRETITGDFTFTATDCSSIPEDAEGVFSSQTASCDVHEEMVYSAGGYAEGGECTFSNEQMGGPATVNRSESTGAFSKNAAASGTYGEFLAAMDALAAVDISTMESSVLAGDSATIFWSADRVKECRVRGANGDAWDSLESPVRGARTGPITQDTVYSISCATDSGATLTDSITIEAR